MTIDTAEKLLVTKVSKYQKEGLFIDYNKAGSRPSFRIKGTRVGTKKGKIRHIVMMKRVSKGSDEMRDDFDQLINKPSVIGDSLAIDAIKSFRKELLRILPSADEIPVNETENQDLPPGSIERYLKTAVQFKIVDAANHADQVVEAMLQLAQALRRGANE